MLANETSGGFPSVAELASFLDETLNCPSFSKVDAALNGLQLGDARPEVRSVVAAVDASLASFQRALSPAAAQPADFLLVHHGLFWGPAQAISGPNYQRIRSLIESNLALYAAHLPLDSHPSLGNAAFWAKKLELEDVQAFGFYKGVSTGLGGSLPRDMKLDEIAELLSCRKGLHLPFGVETIRRVAILTGGGAFSIPEAAASGYDLLLTGEVLHQHYHQIQELGLNVLAMGHYYSEIGGVLQLLEAVQEKWPQIQSNFIDIPTGL